MVLIIHFVCPKQDWFEVTDADERTQDRYCFLFRQKLLITDQQNLGFDKKVYLIRNQFKVSRRSIDVVQCRKQSDC